MTNRINGVKVTGIVEFLESGIKESQRVAIRNSLVDDDGYEDELGKFANRMTVRLNTAIKRIQELEAEATRSSQPGDDEASNRPDLAWTGMCGGTASRSSWDGDVDRQGGSFTDAEVLESMRGGEGW